MGRMVKQNLLFYKFGVFPFRLRTSGTPLYQLSSGQPQVYRVSPKKLRDIQQEREGASSNKLRPIFNDFVLY